MSIPFTTEITCDTLYLGKWLSVVQLFGAGAEIQMLAVRFCVLYNIYALCNMKVIVQPEHPYTI